ncbi:MAG: ABC transporter substrate-binding protein, partial [Pseudanabaenales cyanobacterium]|nr:ABC transporter substrate-binding protein [Pseudanabaenales cyanobacterium]
GDHFAPHQGDYTNPNQQIPYLGRYITQPLANVGDGFNPSIEAIIQVKPDLILGDNANANQYETLSKIAPTLLLDRFAPNAHLRIIAQAVDRSKQVEQILIETDQRIASARETLATVIATYPKALLLGSSQLKKISVYSNSPNTNNQCGSLVEELGFKLVYPLDFGEVPRASPMPISLEILPQLNEADLVILFGHNFSKVEQLNGLNDFEAHSLSNLKQAWQESEIAQSLNASKIGRVYFIPTYLCGGLPGPIGAKFYLEELKEQLLSSN